MPGLLLWGLLAAVGSAAAVPAGEGAVVWREDVDAALTLAAAEYRPVLLLFSSPACTWCRRLQTESLSQPQVEPLLRQFVLAHVDVTRDQDTAERYQVTGVPTLLLVQANGRVARRLTGYVAPEALAKFLVERLSPEALRARNPTTAALLARLEEGKPPEAEDWPALMLALGQAQWHDEIKARLRALTPLPRAALVRLLEHRLLAVRLGALEVLEEAAGEDFGFDPWRPALAASVTGLGRWRDWAAATAPAEPGAAAPPARYSSLSADDVARCLEDLVSAPRDRAARALQQLGQAGPEVAPLLAAYLDEHPQLPAGVRNRIREARYVMLLAALPGADTSGTAHKLVFGTPDVRMDAIRGLAAGGVAAVPVLQEFLAAAPEPMVREAAVDALVATGRLEVVPVLADHIRGETDREVVYTMVHGLGELRSKRAQKLLLSYLGNEDEDLVVAALQGLARQGAKVEPEGIVRSLSDPRWRVRATTLETVAKLRLTGVAEAVTRLLQDPDEFVRHAATKAVASAGGKKAAPQLEALFLADDRLKPAALAGLCDLERPLPTSFGPALDGKEPELLLAVFQAMEEAPPRDLWLAARFANHQDPEVAAAAVRVLASRGLKHGPTRACLVRVLRRGCSEELAAAVFDAVDLDEVAPVLRDSEVTPDRGASLPAATDTVSSAAMAVLAAFGVEPHVGADTGPSLAQKAVAAFLGPESAAAAAPGTAGEASPAAAVLSAFAGAGPGAGAGAGPGVPAAAESATLRDFGEAVLPYLDVSHAPATRRAAALVVTCLGRRAGLPVLESGLAECTVAEREQIATGLRAAGIATTGAADALLSRLLDDPAAEVRAAAVQACWQARREPLVDAVFQALSRPGATLEPVALLEALASGWGRGRQSARLRYWAGQLLADAVPGRRTLGLFLLECCWQAGDGTVLRPFLASDDPWQRRAAWHALGRHDPEAFLAGIATPAHDASEQVRLVVPAVYASTGRWVRYLDGEHFREAWDAERVSTSLHGSGQSSLPEAAAGALRELTRDPLPVVRFEAFLCLLERRVPLDLAKLIATVEALPDRKAAAERVGSFLATNYRELGPPFAVLLPYLEGSRHDESTVENVTRHLEAREAATPAAKAALRASRPTGQEAILAEFLPPTPPPAVSRADSPVTLVYFHSPGCQDCERVEKLLAEMHPIFPRLTIESHSIRKLAAVTLNEALCQRFGVPEKLRLVTPAVFCRAGGLVKQEISLASLGEKLSASVGHDDTEWAAVPEQELVQAEQAVTDRYAALTLGVVAVAGLLDGVNPCAFATIVFLLSYLRLTRRRPREIAHVGLAFVTGVFLAYVALGLGLIEVVARIQVLRQLSHGLNWVLAAGVLVLAVLSVRDGVLCLRGRLADMALQLPAVLKRHIHRVVREGSRHRHFVVAAFIAGVLISLLELACTGQVYAPTIIFMLKAGRNTWGALRYLLLYNLAFVAPLLVIFALAYGGLRSETLGRVLQRHAASVKFASAGLFLAIFVLFVFGTRFLTPAG